MRLKKLALAAICTFGLVALASPVYAASTQTHDGTVTMPSANPCTGAPGMVTLNYHDASHFSSNASGGISFTDTMNGKFSFVPTDSSQPSYTGNFTSWDGGQMNGNNQETVFTATFSVKGKGSDGSHLVYHEVAHTTVTRDGTVTTSFDKPTCSGS